jgi:TonB family protein
MIMKYNKTIYLTAFLLSLSLILLLEAASLGFLAEDIKPVEKKEVEIELLLTASNHSAAEITQPGEKEKLKEAKAEQGDNFSEKKETVVKETVKSSSNKNEKKELEKNDQFVKEEEKEVDEAEIKTEKIQKENDLKTEETEETEEKVEEPKKEAQEAENNEKLDKIKPTEQEETSSENKEVEKKQDQMPAWLNNSKNEKEEDNSKEAKTKKEENEDKFDLDSYLAELENEDLDEKENEINDNLSSSNQNSRVNEAEEAGENRDNKSENKVENKEFSADEGAPQNNEKREVYDLREGRNDIQKPGLKNYSQPEYPSNLRKRNIEGEVIISLRIDKAGKAHDLKISQSSGYDSFDQAALSAVSNWRFEAAEKDGIKVEVIVNLPIRFKLN